MVQIEFRKYIGQLYYFPPAFKKMLANTLFGMLVVCPLQIKVI